MKIKHLYTHFSFLTATAIIINALIMKNTNTTLWATINKAHVKIHILLRKISIRRYLLKSNKSLKDFNNIQ